MQIPDNIILDEKGPKMKITSRVKPGAVFGKLKVIKTIGYILRPSGS